MLSRCWFAPAREDIAFRTAYLITRNAADAEDVAQDALVKAHRALGRFRPRRSPSAPGCSRSSQTRPATAAVRPGVAGLALRAAGEAASGDAAPSPEAVTVAADERRQLLAAVDRLPDDQRFAVALPLPVLDLSEQETADVLGVPVGTGQDRGSRVLSTDCGRTCRPTSRPGSARSARTSTTPATPDLLGGVAGRLRCQAPPPRPAAPPWALAVLVAAVGAVLAASPGARSAFLELFHLSGATVARVETLPPVTEPESQPRAGARPAWAPGTAVPLAEARRRVGFRIRIPRTADTKAGAQRAPRRAGRRRRHARVVLQARDRADAVRRRGRPVPPEARLAGHDDRVRPGRRAAGVLDRRWLTSRPLPGAPTETSTRASCAVAGNVLLWVDDDVTLRLAGRLTKQQALELAATIR